MGGKGGKWRKMEENGEKWRKMGGEWGIVRNCQKYLAGNVEKMCEIRRKWEENRDNLGQM